MRDDEWNDAARDERPEQRLDRNWADLLQELRVVQTGVQLLTGFLLTLPFQQRFTTIGSFDRAVYLVAVAASVLATGLLQAPVSLHRGLFRQHRRAVTVSIAHRLAVAGMALLGVAVVAVTVLIVGVVTNRTAAIVCGCVAALFLLGLWLVLPLAVRASGPEDRPT